LNDATSIYRLTIGLLIFAVLLAVDCWKRPKELRRLKEYSFLFGITALAMVYGIAHDFVTWSISPAYFVLFKGIASAADKYGPEMIKLAMMATWSVGLITAAVLLMANNPGRLGRPLPYSRLVRIATIPLGVSILTEILLGLAFHWYEPYSLAHERIAMLTLGRHNVFTVWGMHIGAYSGGIIGLVIAVIRIVRLRRSNVPL
jgi:hypothetical protein